MRNLREYVRPATADDAVSAKQAHGTRAAYLAGGSDLLVHRPPHLEVMIDIRHCGLNDVRSEDGHIVIGGAALLRDAEAAVTSVAAGMLADAFRDTAPWLIRNAATVSGNIANASPAADAVPALIALDAVAVLAGGDVDMAPVGEIPAGPHRTNLGDALITAIRIPTKPRRGSFVKLARSHSDIALVNLAMSFVPDGGRMRDVRVALGAVAPVAVRAGAAEAVLEGQEPTDDIIAEAARAVNDDIRPISDWRASEAYRRRMSGVLLGRAVHRARQRTETE
ncbi:MAG TPA: FAD binding domain-containing protein [Chloroflexota bacterium]|nr:FAD binding domain-containing protein [Chloroflexota bacterium]